MLEFGKTQKAKKLGREIGRFCGIFVFLSVFYVILSLLNKLPSGISYLWVILLTIFIYAIKRMVYGHD